MRQGDSFDERLRAAGAHRRRPPGPPVTGDALLKDRHLRSAGKTRPDYLSCPGPLGPVWLKIKKSPRCTDTAYSGITVAAGQLLGASARPPPHQTGRQAPGGVQ